LPCCIVCQVVDGFAIANPLPAFGLP
jgi:hypothetical protein